jgi:hypothetical protein
VMSPGNRTGPELAKRNSEGRRLFLEEASIS